MENFKNSNIGFIGIIGMFLIGFAGFLFVANILHWQVFGELQDYFSYNNMVDCLIITLGSGLALYFLDKIIGKQKKKN